MVAMNTLSEEADRIEKQIISDFEDDSTVVLDALIGFLQEIKKGEYEEIADCLYSSVDISINCFNDRHKNINRFINSAIRWQAEQIAIEEEKLTRPTP
jgi:hypothetical protein